MRRLAFLLTGLATRLGSDVPPLGTRPSLKRLSEGNES